MDKKKQKIYSGIALLALALLVVGATYAYFQNQNGDSSQTDVKVTTYTTDLLTFETGDAINIIADQETFAQGKGNRTGSSFAKAILQANSKTNVATANYYIYLNIESNEFIYTSEEQKAELVLQVTDNTGNPVTSIDGLTYVTTVDGSGTSISGFDITENKGIITLVNNKEISASPKIEERYNVTLVLVNYDFDQNNNAGKNFSAKLMIQKDEYKQTVADYVISQFTGTQGENGLYYHDSSLENGAGDNSYRYAGANPNNYVCFGSTQSLCPADNLYRIIGVFGDKVKLIKSDYATSALLGTDGDYYSSVTPNATYYKGKFTNINTYKWQGSSSCSNSTAYVDNGIIKLASMPEKTESACSIWKLSELNKTNINTNYLNNIGSEWANMIDTTTWKVGGIVFFEIGNANSSVIFQNEIVNPKYNDTYDAKIGLMYVSDYGFAANPSAWTTGVHSYNNTSITSQNWMHMGLDEWTISYRTDGYNYVFVVKYSGEIDYNSSIDANAARPVFYLLSSIKYFSGSGTQSDPIRIAD